MTLWLVRAGKAGEKEAFALENRAAVIGWEELPDLSACTSRDELMPLLQHAYPTERRKTLSSWQNQIWPMRETMQVGDLVALPLKCRPAIAFGRVAGDYDYREDPAAGPQHTRPVDWLAQIPRSALDPDMLFSFGAFMTVCRIARHDAEQRIRGLLDRGGWPAGDARPTPSTAAAAPIGPRLGNLRPVSDPPIALGLEALERQWTTMIRDRIGRRFSGHGLARLVGALLEVKGYKVRVSPPGIDGGVDILAGSGPLGLDAPRLVVQVKSSEAKVDVRILRELSGTMERFRAEQGLLVGWGGFNSAVRAEAAPDFFRLRLWTADDVVAAVQEEYDRLPPAIRAEIPLRRMWALEPEPIVLESCATAA